MSHPALPEPAHADQDSMLSRKFGREVANYFSGMLLHLLSFLRDGGLLYNCLPLNVHVSELCLISRLDVKKVRKSHT